MPGAWAHGNYWATQAPEVPSTVAVQGGYPAWQTTIIIGGGFGAAQTVWEWLSARSVTGTQGRRDGNRE